MRALSKEECAEVSGSGAFSYLTNIAFAALGMGVGAVFGGPAGAIYVGAMVLGVGTGANVIYDAANADRESQRVENYDAFGNKQG